METKFEVVISGISGRFPECDDVATFKSKLYNSENLVTLDDRKWPLDYTYEYGQANIPSHTGKYIDAKAIDLRVFKLNDKYGKSKMVQSRKAAETAFEAIIDAGINPYSLSGRNIGVFASCGIVESDASFYANRAHPEILMIIGNARTMMSNRISYAFNFTGQSLTFHSDILGDIEALHTAYALVSQGLTEAAVVVASSYIIEPRMSLSWMGLKVLSSDGTNRIFDKEATGFTKSEGTVALFIQRADDAKRNYGTIVLCDSLYPGYKSNRLIEYNKTLSTKFLQNIYTEEEYKEILADIPFIELSAHGMLMHDETEIKAIIGAICEKRKKSLLLGSVVSNIGHTEASAPYMSILKALFTLDEGVIPPNINYSSKSCQKIEALQNESVQVAEKAVDLKLNGNTVGVNVLGISGYMGHVVLKQNCRTKNETRNDSLPRLLMICGRSEDKLCDFVQKIESMPFDEEFIFLTNEAFTSHMPLHTYRAYVTLPKKVNSRKEIRERNDSNRPIWFVFSGMGSQWNGMGKGLLKLPIFANVIKKCDEILRPKGVDLYEILTSDDPEIFDNIIHSFVGIISIQIGLVEVLRALNIHPDGIIGHSVGENGCAYADGCLTLEQAVLASYERGKASVEANTIRGMMAAIGKGYQDMKNSLPPNIEVACHNSERSCTISGPAEDVEIFVQKLMKDGVFAKSVNVANIAYHSKYISPAAPQLLSSLKKVIVDPKKRSSKWKSTSIPESDWDKPLSQYCSAEYLTNNLLNSVLFEEVCKHIPAKATVIEIAPHGLLQPILKKSFPKDCTTHISLTLKSALADNLNQLLSAIGKIYIAGYDPYVNALFPSITYPVSKGTPSLSPFCSWLREDMTEAMHLAAGKQEPISSVYIPIKIQEDAEFSFVKNHVVHDQVVAPMSLFLVLVWRTFSIQNKKKLGTFSFTFQNIKVHKHFKPNLKKDKYVSILVQKSGAFEVCQEKEHERFAVILTGIIKETDGHPEIKLQENIWSSETKTYNQNEIYDIFTTVGLKLKEDFELIKKGRFSATGSVGEIIWNGNWVTFLESLLNFPIIEKTKRNSVLFYPSKIRSISICHQQFADIEKGSVITCHSELTLRQIHCNGLEVHGIEYNNLLPPRKQSAVSHKTLNFTSDLKSLQKFTICNNFQSETIKIKYYRLHDEETVSQRDVQQNEVVYGLEYAGLHKSGCRVMGVALTNDSGATLDPDPFLMWTIPDDWNLENAATIPLAYIQAYYIQVLDRISSHFSEKSILINMGKEIWLTEACLTIWLQQDAQIFISVDNNEEGNWIRQKYHMSKNIYILDQENCRYEMQLLAATEGLGVNVVVNCVPGFEHVVASTGCLGFFSCFIELGQQDCCDMNNFGLYTFLKSTSFKILPQAVSNFVHLPTNEKKLLKKQIEEGIQNGLISPFYTSIKAYNFESVDKNGVKMVSEYMSNAGGAAPLHLDANHSYVIMGEARNASWIKTLDWLVDQGARKFFIALNHLNLNAQLSHRINRIVNKHKCSVYLMPPQQKSSIDGIMKLIVNAQEVAPVEAVFVVSMESEVVHYADVALRNAQSYAHLISLFSGGLDHCEARRYSGYPAIVIQGKNTTINMSTILNEFRMILSNNDNNNIPTILDVIKDATPTDAETRVPGLNRYLPKTIRMLEECGEHASSSLRFIEVPSLSPRYQYTKGINPIFVIPSVHENHLEPVVRKLMYPVFSATVSNCTGSIKQMVSELYKNLNTIQPTGSVTLIGETWNAILAIELSLLFQQKKRQYKLLIIEGNPNFWYDSIQKMSMNGSVEFDNRLLEELFGSCYQVSKSTIKNDIPFEEKIANYLSQFEMSDQAKKQVIKTITIIRKQLMRVLQYEVADRIFYHTIIFQERKLNDYIFKLSVTSEVKEIREATYEDFIRNSTITNTINCNAAFSLWH